jgi:citrate lyase subunit gamma (acyl carrier protein)
MKIKREAMAGSLESADCLVMVRPSETLEIEIESAVMKRYGKAIRAAIIETLEEMSITAGYYKIQDRGALNYCLQARVTTATRKGCEGNDR